MVTIRPFASEADVQQSAAAMAASEPWLTLGRDVAQCLRVLSDDSRERYVAESDGRFAGFLIVNMRGAFTGYIQTVCVEPNLRGRGLGAQLVAYAEERIFRDSHNVFLCVSSFNEGARRLYERLGYETVGTLRDYLVPGLDEILMRKTRGPILGTRVTR